MKILASSWLVLICLASSRHGFRIERQVATEGLEVEPPEAGEPGAVGAAGAIGAPPQAGPAGNAAAGGVAGEVEVETPEWEIPVTTAPPGFQGYAPQPMMTTPPFDIISNGGLWFNAFYPGYFQTTVPPQDFFVAAIPTAPGIEPGFINNIPPTAAPPPYFGMVPPDGSAISTGHGPPGDPWMVDSLRQNTQPTGILQSNTFQLASVRSNQSPSSIPIIQNRKPVLDSATNITPSIIASEKISFTSPAIVSTNKQAVQIGAWSPNVVRTNNGVNPSPVQGKSPSLYELYLNVVRNQAQAQAHQVHGQANQIHKQANLPSNTVISGNRAVFEQAGGPVTNHVPSNRLMNGRPPIDVYRNIGSTKDPRSAAGVQTSNMLTPVVIVNSQTDVSPRNVVPIDNPIYIGAAGNVDVTTTAVISTTPSPSPTTPPPTVPTEPIEFEPTEAPEIEPTQPTVTVPSTTMPTTSAVVTEPASNVAALGPAPVAVSDRMLNVVAGPVPGFMAGRTQNAGPGHAVGSMSVVAGPVPGFMTRPRQAPALMAVVAGNDNVPGLVPNMVPGSVLNAVNGLFPGAVAVSMPGQSRQDTAAGRVSNVVAGPVAGSVSGYVPNNLSGFLPGAVYDRMSNVGVGQAQNAKAGPERGAMAGRLSDAGAGHVLNIKNGNVPGGMAVYVSGVSERTWQNFTGNALGTVPGYVPGAMRGYASGKFPRNIPGKAPGQGANGQGVAAIPVSGAKGGHVQVGGTGGGPAGSMSGAASARLPVTGANSGRRRTTQSIVDGSAADAVPGHVPASGANPVHTSDARQSFLAGPAAGVAPGHVNVPGADHGHAAIRGQQYGAKSMVQTNTGNSAGVGPSFAAGPASGSVPGNTASTGQRVAVVSVSGVAPGQAAGARQSFSPKPMSGANPVHIAAAWQGFPAGPVPGAASDHADGTRQNFAARQPGASPRHVVDAGQNVASRRGSGGITGYTGNSQGVVFGPLGAMFPLSRFRRFN